MRCQVVSRALDTALRFLNAATAGARTPLPILSHILLEADDSVLQMVATNLTLWLQWRVDARVDEPGRLAVAGKEWRGLIASLNETSVTLEAPSEGEMGGRLTVRFGGAEYRLPILPADEFPEPSEASWQDPFEMEGRPLAEAVRKVFFAASTDPTMGIYTGIHFHRDEADDRLDIVATDTHRMALKRVEMACPPLTLTVPLPALKVLLPLWEKEPVVAWRVSTDNSMVAFEGASWKATVTALAGTFPSYRRVIPNQFAHTVAVKVEVLLAALRRMVIFRPTNKRTPQRVLLRLHPDDTMEVVALEMEYGSYEEVGREAVPIQWQTPPTDYQIAFQHPYLAEFLGAVRSGEVLVGFQETNNAAAVWRPMTEDTYQYIVMPLHLPGSEGL